MFSQASVWSHMGCVYLSRHLRRRCGIESGVCLGGVFPGKWTGRNPPPPPTDTLHLLWDGYRHGRYASYWKAYLFHKCLVLFEGWGAGHMEPLPMMYWTLLYSPPPGHKTGIVLMIHLENALNKMLIDVNNCLFLKYKVTLSSVFTAQFLQVQLILCTKKYELSLSRDTCSTSTHQLNLVS